MFNRLPIHKIPDSADGIGRRALSQGPLITLCRSLITQYFRACADDQVLKAELGKKTIQRIAFRRTQCLKPFHAAEEIEAASPKATKQDPRLLFIARGVLAPDSNLPAHASARCARSIPGSASSGPFRTDSRF